MIGAVIFTLAAIAWAVVWHIDFNRLIDFERPKWTRLEEYWAWRRTTTRQAPWPPPEVVDTTCEEIDP